MRRREFLKNAGIGLAASSAAVGLATSRAAGSSASATPATPGAPQGPALTPGNAASAAGTATACTPPAPGYIGPLPLVRATPDRIIAITVCTRPFRASGPRIETERMGRKTIVHNYGHGGTG